MRKLPIIVLCLVLFPVWSHAAGQAEVFVVFSSDIVPYRQALDGFREALRVGPWNPAFVEHSLKEEGAERVAREMARQRPALVFAIGPEAARFAGESIGDIPVVFAMVLNAGTFAGANVTGVSLEVPVRTKLERIRRLLPATRRIGVIHSRGATDLHEEVARACRELGLRLVEKEIDSGEELHEAFDALAGRIDLFIMVPDPKIYFPKTIEHLLRDGLKHKVPIIGLSSSYTRAGALASFEADYADMGRQAAEMALRIAGGQSPRAIKPSGPRRVKTSINLAVAERLGIAFDPEAIKEADDVFR
jgi:putative ABC transport system substrate-binding protein